MHRPPPSGAKVPFHPVAFAPPRVALHPRADGFDLVNPVALEPFEPSIAHMLRRQAAAVPTRDFLAEREPTGGWHRISYGEASQRADALAQALLERGCGPDRPLVILSGNGLDHALLMLAASIAATPVVPVSVAYSLLSGNFANLRHIFDTVRPAVVYASSGKAFAGALAALDLGRRRLIIGGEPLAGMAAESIADIMRAAARSAAAPVVGVGPETVAKILFTSGSTGLPKGVINTHRMLCANQKMIEQVWPFLRREPPILVDWLPWNHTFGGNHNFNMVLAHGGTLYIDAGRPIAGQLAPTVRNLAEVSPTIYFNVPAGYAMLLPHLEGDPGLANSFFARLQVIFYAGASLSQDLWDRLEALSVRVTGRRVPMVSSWGATETAPAVTGAHLLVERAGIIGLPLPGVTLGFRIAGTKLEMRVRGPNVFPGYLQRPDLTRAAFDEEGFYRSGDAGRLAAADDPSQGVIFDGRVAENFKLATGTWVHVGALRLAALEAAAPALHEAVVVGHDRDCVGLLAWPSLDGLKRICTDLALHADPQQLIEAPAVIDHIRNGIAAHNVRNSASSHAIRRILLMLEPPSIDANEITDKGYVNQRAVLERRAALVARLYATPPSGDVILIP